MDARDLRHTFVLANAFKEGDLAVGGTSDDRIRETARRVLESTTIGEIRRTVLVEDAMTAAMDRSRDRRFDSDLDPLTIARVKALLLGSGGTAWARQHRDALSSEVAAAVAKVMSDEELSSVAGSLFNAADASQDGVGAPGHFGSRIQPNSPGDDEQEILFSILEGLSYGCGDVVIGLNPASDDLDTIVRLEQLLEQVVRRLDLPTRFCVLSDIVTQSAARRHTRVDVGFQSLAGTSRALVGMAGLDVDGLLELTREFGGLYFETGQGSAVTNGTAHGVDMVTLEARAYGLARHVRRSMASPPWMIVNDVAGFIGPEVFRDASQLERACLEDTVMAKLQGITMGLDVCATFHMGITPAALRAVTRRVARRAAPAYLMSVAGNADPMLGYLTTSFREHPALRRDLRRSMSRTMQQRLTALGALRPSGEPTPGPVTVARLYAAYATAGGDRRSSSGLEEEGRLTLAGLQERGFDLALPEAIADARLESLYSHARAALYASLDEGVLRDVTPDSVRVRTAAAHRDDYLAHPPAGERLREDDARVLATLPSATRGNVQIVVSDGLNANAVNEQLRALLPPLRRHVTASGHHVGATDIVVRNGRVRVGYEIGGLLGAAVVVHLIGERPGTGLNTLSAYVTYGMDDAGRSRWSSRLDHSVTTAVCGIHPKGTPPPMAAQEIARVIRRIFERRVSGVALHAPADRG